MTHYIIQIENMEEETLLDLLLDKLKVSFQKEREEEFELTDEMKSVIDERLKIDRSTYIDSDVVMAELDAKYGL